jgi:hypothetical protein
MSIPNEVPESSMEEILASIRKIISEDESRGANATAAPSPPPSRPSPPTDNVSPLFAGRRGATRFGGDGADIAPATGVEKTPAAEARDKTRADTRSAEAREARPKPEVHAPPRLPEPAPIQRSTSDRALLSASTEAAVTASFAELKAAAAREDPSAVEQLAEELMRPMVKAWLDQNLPPLVERIVREEIERLSRKR